MTDSSQDSVNNTKNKTLDKKQIQKLSAESRKNNTIKIALKCVEILLNENKKVNQNTIILVAKKHFNRNFSKTTLTKFKDEISKHRQLLTNQMMPREIVIPKIFFENAFAFELKKRNKRGSKVLNIQQMKSLEYRIMHFMRNMILEFGEEISHEAFKIATNNNKKIYQTWIGYAYGIAKNIYEKSLTSFEETIKLTDDNNFNKTLLNEHEKNNKHSDPHKKSDPIEFKDQISEKKRKHFEEKDKNILYKKIINI